MPLCNEPRWSAAKGGAFIIAVSLALWALIVWAL